MSEETYIVRGGDETFRFSVQRLCHLGPDSFVDVTWEEFAQRLCESVPLTAVSALCVEFSEDVFFATEQALVKESSDLVDQKVKKLEQMLNGEPQGKSPG